MGGVQFGGGEGYVIEVIRFQSIEKMAKNFCPQFLQPLLKNVDKKSCNDVSRELIPMFYNPPLQR